MEQLYKPGCPFCERALKKEYDYIRRSYISMEIISFEPLNPVTPGHRLFMPKTHVEHGRWSNRIVGAVYEAAYEYATGYRDDFNLIISSGEAATQTIDHIHVHYVPRRPNDNLTLPWTGQKKEH